MPVFNEEELRRFSADIRIWTTREVAAAGFGHIGGSASIADALAVLYGCEMNIDPSRPDWPERDYFVLSKGHCAPALYAALALKGYFPVDWLNTLNRNGTNLPSHADRLRVPGVDMSTGSLGQGLSAAAGIAAANRLKGRDSYTYCIIGDGETNEGQIWEACDFAVHKGLDRLIVLVDWNKKQLDGRLEDIGGGMPLKDKFEAFGLDARVVPGYDCRAIHEAVAAAKAVKGAPHCIILDTFKGLGVKLAEEQEFNHYLSFGPEQAEKSVAEIEKRLAEGSYPGGDFKW